MGSGASATKNAVVTITRLRQKRKAVVDSNGDKKSRTSSEQGPVSPALAIFEAAADLGLDPCREMELLWLAEHMTQNLPDGWTRHQDATHGSFFSNRATGESRWEHPRQHVYKEVIGLHRRALRERSFKGANEDAEKAGEEAWSEAEVAWRVVRQRRKKARWRKVVDSITGKSLPGTTEDIRKVALEEHRLRLKLLERVRGMHLEFEAADATRSQKKLSHIPGLHGEASLAAAFGAGGIWADREHCVELGVDVDQGDESAELTGFTGLVRRTKSRVAAVTQKFSRMWLNGGPSEEDARSEEDAHMDVAKVARLAALMRKSMARTLQVPQMELRLQEAVNLGLRRYHAASMIQGMVRGRLQRNRFRLVIEHYRIRVHCAKLIQTHVRQWSRRRREKLRTLRTNSKGRRGSLFQPSRTVGHLSSSVPVGKLSRPRSSSNASVQSLPAVGKTTSLHMGRPSVWALPEVFNNVALPAKRPSIASSTPTDSCLKARRHSVSSQTESYSVLSSPGGSPSSSQKHTHFSAQAEILDSELPRAPGLPTGTSSKPALRQLRPETPSFMLPESDQGNLTASETLRLQEVSRAEERRPKDTLAEEQKVEEPQAARQEGTAAANETGTVQEVDASLEEQRAAEEEPLDTRAEKGETTEAHRDQVTAASEPLAEAQAPEEGGVVDAGEPGQDKQDDASTGAAVQEMEDRPSQEADVDAQQQQGPAEDGDDGEVSRPQGQEPLTGGAKDADVAAPQEQEEEQQEASPAGAEGAKPPLPQELPTASAELAEVSAVEAPTAGAEGAATPVPEESATALAERAELPAPLCAKASAPQEPSTAELPGPQELPTAAEAPAPPVEGKAERHEVRDGGVQEPQAGATPEGEEELEETPAQGAESADKEEGREQAGAQEQFQETVQQTEPQDAEEAAQASGLPTGPREVEATDSVHRELEENKAATEDGALAPAREDAEALQEDQQKVDVTDSGLVEEGPASVDVTVLEAEPRAQGKGAQEETWTQTVADEGELGPLPSQPGPPGAGEGPEAAEPAREVGHGSPAAGQEEEVQTMEPVSSEGALVPMTKGTEEPERLLEQAPVSKVPERPVTVTTKEVGVQVARDEASSSEAPERGHSRGDRGRVGGKREDCRQLPEERKGRRAPSQPNKAPLLAPPLPKAKPRAFSSASESHEDGAAEVSQAHPQELADYAVGAAVRAARALSSSSISSMKDTYAELSSAPASDTQAPKPADFALRAADFYEIMRAQRQRKGEEGSAQVRSQSAGAGHQRARDEGADPSSALMAQSRAARFFEENRRILQSFQPGRALQQEKTRPSPRDQCPVPLHTVTQRPSTAGHQKRSGTKPQRSASAGYLRQPAAAALQDPVSTFLAPALLVNQGPSGAARVFQRSCSSSGHVCNSQELLPLIDATIDAALEMGLRRSRGRRSGARRGVNRVATLPAAPFEHLSFGDELTLKRPLPASSGGLF